MERIVVLLVALTATGLACFPRKTVAGDAENVGNNVASDKVWVWFSADEGDAAKTSLANQDYQLVRKFRLVRAELWSIPKGTTQAAALHDLKSVQGILSVTPDTRIPGYVCNSEDPEQYALPQMWWPEAWDECGTLSNILVAVMDTGLQLDHPDLESRTFVNTAELQGTPGVDDDENGYIDDFYGWDYCGPTWDGDQPDNDPSPGASHGTMVAGIIAANRNNNMGIDGATDNATVLPLKIAGDSGITVEATCTVDAMEYAADMGAKVVNASYGHIYHLHLGREAIQGLQNEGILFVAAAGNNGVDNDAYLARNPCSYNLANIISVMATGKSDATWGSSNYGASSVDVAAPGADIRSTSKSSSYATESGTSFSAPYVTALAAILRAKYPTISVRELRLMILESADPRVEMTGRCVTGARANAYAALSVPVPKTITNTDVCDPVIAVPDNDVDGITRTMNIPDEVYIRGVSVSVTMSHSRMEDLEISVASPSQRECTILNRPARPGSVIYPGPWMTGQAYVFDTQWTFRGDTSNGNWQLTVKDLSSGATGSLEEWAIELLTYDDDATMNAAGGLLCSSGSTVTITNSIVYGNTAYTGLGTQIAVLSSTNPSVVTVDYSDVDGAESDVYVDNDCTLDWGDNNIDSDPLFSTTAGDYHLQSTYGRWDPTQEDWAIDQSDSPCLDKGDAEPTNEPEPCGFKINLGAYGDTVEASKSKWPLTGDANGDCQVDVRDLLFIRNRLSQDPSSGDNWKANVNEDATINILDLLFARNNLGNTCE